MPDNNPMWNVRLFAASDDPAGAALYADAVDAFVTASRLARPSRRDELAAASLLPARPASLRDAGAWIVVVEDPQSGDVAGACHSVTDVAGACSIRGLLRTELGDRVTPRIAVATSIVAAVDRGATSFSAVTRVFPHGRFTDDRGIAIVENHASLGLFTRDFAFVSSGVTALEIVGDWRDRHLRASAEPDGSYRVRTVRSTHRTIPLARDLLARRCEGRAA